jgi:hypothetical protein
MSKQGEEWDGMPVPPQRKLFGPVEPEGPKKWKGQRKPAVKSSAKTLAQREGGAGDYPTEAERQALYDLAQGHGFPDVCPPDLRGSTAHLPPAERSERLSRQALWPTGPACWGYAVTGATSRKRLAQLKEALEIALRRQSRGADNPVR